MEVKGQGLRHAVAPVLAGGHRHPRSGLLRVGGRIPLKARLGTRGDREQSHAAVHEASSVAPALDSSVLGTSIV